jgi:hypothetical protein
VFARRQVRDDAAVCIRSRHPHTPGRS